MPGISILYYGTDDFKNSIKDHYPAITTWLDRHAFAFAMYTIAAIIFEFFISHIIHDYAIQWRSTHKGDERMLINLVRAFNAVVVAKSDRFREAWKRVNKGEINRDAVFDTITRPDQQIAIITQQICELFERIYLDSHKSQTDVIRVRILSVENGLLDYYYYAPENLAPTTPIAVLRESGSTASHCLTKKKSKFIPDIEKELSKPKRCYIPSRDDADDDEQDKDRGSLYSFPVIHENEVIYVICVSCREKGILVDRHQEYYYYALKEFSDRIRLEHQLINIKRHYDI